MHALARTLVGARLGDLMISSRMAAKSSEKENSQNHQGTVNTVKNYVDRFLFAASCLR